MTTSYPPHLVQNLLDAASHLTLYCWRFDSADEYSVADDDMEALCAAVADLSEVSMSRPEHTAVVQDKERLSAAAPVLYDFVQALAEPFPEDINFWDWFDDVQAYARRLVNDLEAETPSKVIDQVAEQS